MSQQGNAPDDLGRLLAIMPFAATIGIALDSATPQQVTGRKEGITRVMRWPWNRPQRGRHLAQ